MTLYEWILANGGPVDFWKDISPTIDAWCQHDMNAAERYSIEGLLNNPSEKERWVNGIVLPFGILLELRNIPLPEEMTTMDFSKEMVELGYRREYE